MDTHKGVNGGRIQAMGNSNYFIIRLIDLLCVSYHCVKYIYNICPVPMNTYIYIYKSYGLDSISCTVFVRFMVYKPLL